MLLLSKYSKRLSASLCTTILVHSLACSAEVLREYPIAHEVYTTHERTVVPVPPSEHVIYPYQLARYEKYGYGKWKYGRGLRFDKRLDIMSSSYSGASIEHTAELLNFFVITDVHIRDKESPAQAIYLAYKGATPLPSSYSGTMLYTTQVLDATVRTINALHKKTPFDFGLSLGDSCNATQYNELRWYLDVLDGKVITPSSGNHAGAHHIDYQKPFKAAGLNKKIPWYQALGNHDHFWYGFLPPNEYIRHILVNRDIINLGNVFTDPRGADSRGFYMGAIDGSTPYGDIIGVGRVKNFHHHPKVAAADRNRRSLLRTEWMKEFFKTTSHPKGHGFHKSNVETGFACYTFEPESNIPIRVIVLDDTQSDDVPVNPTSLGYGHGSLDKGRFEWLVRELDRGQADGKLMIIAAHIPIGVTDPGAKDGWENHEDELAILAKLHTYPNLILWVAGHRHENIITPLPSPDAGHPELGFWEVETASLLAFPQQFRTFRIVSNRDQTLSIFAMNVDPAVKKGSLAAKSRIYAIGAYQIFKNHPAYPPTGAYNAELVKQLTPEMQEKIALLADKKSMK